MKAKPGIIRELLQNNPTLTQTEIARLAGVSHTRVHQVAKQEKRRATLREAQQAEASLPFRDRRVANLPMSVRLRNCLRNVGPDTRNPTHPAWRPPTPTIITVGDLRRWTAADLLMLRNFGRACLSEMRELFIANGFIPQAGFDAPWYPPRETPPAAVLPTARGTH